MQIPIYISVLFAACTLFCAFVLIHSVAKFKIPLILITLWLLLQSIIGLTGFYYHSFSMPPRILVLVAPPIITLLFLFLSKSGKMFLDSLNIKYLNAIHVLRIPVEFGLYFLFLNSWVPEIMTFEGRNFDILAGLTAPLIYYFGYMKRVLSQKILLLWNVLSLMLLMNIVITALLSTPYPLNTFGIEPTNRAIFYFPVIFLPGFIVPAVLLAHFASIRKLLSDRKANP